MATVQGQTLGQLAKSLSTTFRLDEQGLLGFSASGAIVRVTIPPEPLQMLSLVRGILLTDVPDYEPEHFFGGAVAFTQFSLWDDSADSIGWRYCEGILSQHGIHATIKELPVARVDGGRDSWLTLSAIALLALLFRWDGWLLSDRGIFLAFVSHDGFIDVALPTQIAAVRFRNEIAGEGVVVIPRISPAGAQSK